MHASIDVCILDVVGKNATRGRAGVRKPGFSAWRERVGLTAGPAQIDWTRGVGLMPGTGRDTPR